MSLRAVNLSDQGIPCSWVSRDGDFCETRASFRLYPDGSHGRDTWPDTQSCYEHLARVVRESAARCPRGHCNGVVRIKPLGRLP